MRRRHFVFACLAVFAFGVWALGVRVADLSPNEGGRKLAAEFFSAALQPAIDFESQETREYGVSFAGKVATVCARTLRFAVAAMSLAFVIGIVGGILGSRAWWAAPSKGLTVLRLCARILSTAFRSVHELIWALVFLAAFGTSPLVAVVAIAVPYGANLAKVFSELFDEADSSASEVMKAGGGSGLASFLGGTFTRALPDLLSYTLYRFECAIRSSVILGFVGIPTLGYEISTAFEDGHYHEIWTYVYCLVIASFVLEKSSASVRHRLTRGTQPRDISETQHSIAQLWKGRSRSMLLRATLAIAVLSVATSWLVKIDWGSGVSWEQRKRNVARFLDDSVPSPVRESGDWSDIWSWLQGHLIDDGLAAVWQTLNLATVAILLAGAVAMVGVFWAALSLARPIARGVRLGCGKWRGPLSRITRALATVARSLPEYLLAFFLLQLFGPTALALILALAIHNLGILLRLGAEVIDNLDPGAEQVLLAQGSTRGTAFISSLMPTAFNRWVLFLFYRWETCIREATVLGMVGIGSLGFLISEAHVRFYYDEMFLWIFLGAALVFVGDILSDAVRRKLAA